MRWSATVIILSLMSTNLWSVEYQIIDLGTLGGNSSAAFGINEAGWIVGNSKPTGSDISHPFLWNPVTGMMQDLDPTSNKTGIAHEINENGQVVGRKYIQIDPFSSSENEGFLWDSTNGLISVPMLGSTQNSALDINNMGVVVGTSELPNNDFHAYTWDTINSPLDLGTLSGTISAAAAINDSDQVVGYSTFQNESQAKHAFLWDNDNGMIDLGTLGGTSSYAHDINEVGQVVGSSKWRTDITGTFNAYLWEDSNHNNISDSGEMLNLGTFYGDSIAYGINDSGQVVGWSSVSSGFLHAFLWDDVNGLTDLNSHLPENSGWQNLSIAYDVNNLGQIVGAGLTDSGEGHAFLMTPMPEPTTLILLVLGSGILRKQKNFYSIKMF